MATTTPKQSVMVDHHGHDTCEPPAAWPGWAPVFKRAFVIGYVAIFLLRLVPSWFPQDERGLYTMAAYAVLFVLGACGWRAELIQQLRWIIDAPLRATAALLMGIVGALVLETAGALVSGWITVLIPAAGARLVNDSNVTSAIDAYPAWAVIGVLACVGPIVEELFFRQFLLPTVADRIREWVGVAVSSVLFGMLHMHSWTVSEWVGIIPHICFGIAAGILFVRTRSNVVLPAALHVFNNINGIVPAL